MKQAERITEDDRGEKAAVYDVFPGMYMVKVGYHIPGFIEERKKATNWR